MAIVSTASAVRLTLKGKDDKISFNAFNLNATDEGMNSFADAIIPLIDFDVDEVIRYDDSVLIDE